MFLFEKIDTIPFWKKVYQTVSGYSASVTSDIVDEILRMTETELKTGYKIYETYSETDFNNWAKKADEKDGHDLIQFIKRLCKCTNLKPDVALPIFFNYLMFEYYGKIDDIKNLILYEHSMLTLIENVWHFYSLERTFYIKTLRHIFECAVNPKHQFKKEYIKFIQKLDIKEFRTNLIQQFGALIKEITEGSLENSLDKKSYVNQNNREQLEFLLLIVMTVEYLELSSDEFQKLFELFTMHNFARQPIYFDATLYGDQKEFEDLKTVEMGCFVVGMHQIGNTVGKLPGDMEVTLKDMQSQGDHKIVLLSWILGKLKTITDSDTEVLKKYEKLLKVLMKNDVFGSVRHFLSTKVMRSETRGIKLIQAGIFKLLEEFVSIVEDKKSLLSNISLIGAIECLLEDTEIAIECTMNRGGLDVVVQGIFKMPDSFREITNFSRTLVKHPKLTDGIITVLGKLNYFQCLFNLTKQLYEHPKDVGAVKREQIFIGYELIHDIVKYAKNDLRSCGFNNCLLLLNQFVNVFEDVQDLYPLVKIYFMIRAAMVLHRDSTVQNEFQGYRMLKHFLPNLRIQENVPESLLQRHLIDSLLLRILRKEEHESTHPTIKTYLELIYHCVTTNSDRENIQVPGVAYVMNFVFPYHKKWHYENLDEQLEISILCLKIMLEVLNRKLDEEDILKKFLMYLLLRNPAMMNTFLLYFVQEKFHLQISMLGEVDWINGKTLDNIVLSKLHLSIFLELLNNSNLKPSDTLLQSKIQTVTKSTASFITNAFSCSLANLACRLLEKLSQDPNIPILAVLEMDYSQIQCLFLEKLRDPLEDDSFKMTALDFINTALKSQNGLTAAFFNASDILSKKVAPADSVCDFMIDYLQNIQKSSHYLTNPVQKSILRVFSTLWSTGRENLVKDIYSLKCFWPLLTDPLFHAQIEDTEIYTHIMTITTIHMMEFQKNVDGNLKKVIGDLFGNVKLIEEWVGYMEKVLSRAGEEEEKNFIFAWKRFIFCVKRVLPDVLTSNEVKYNLILSCLKGIIWHFSLSNDDQIVNDLSEVYLILIVAWRESYRNKYENLDLLTTVLKTYVGKSKNSVNRDVLLTVVYKVIKDSSELIQSNPSYLVELLKPVSVLFEREYKRLSSKELSSKSIMCWVLIAQIADATLSLETAKPFTMFFTFTKYISRTFEMIQHLINEKESLPMVKVLLNSLIRYVQSDISMDFFRENCTILFDIIDPSKSIIPNLSKEELPTQLKELWIIYAMIIKFNRVLLEKYGEKIIDINLNFVSVYDRVIIQMVCLVEYTVDDRALDLSFETVHYLNKMLEWSKVWSIKSNTSFGLLIVAIKRLINTCISTLLRPENIHFYEITKLGKLNYVFETPSTLIAKIANRLMELACFGFQCLIKCNPSMTDLLSIEQPTFMTYLLIEYDFTVPKFDIPINEDLTYGRLLCLIYFLCKTLNQEFSTDTSETLSNYIGFVEYPKSIDHVLQPTKLSTFLHYGEQVNTDSWTKNLSKDRVQRTFEFLMTFLSVQVFFHVHTLQKPQLQYFKRELYSELQFFNDYAKKLATDELNKSKRKSDPQDIDVINRLVREKMSKNEVDEICDKYFLLAISKWFINVCQLS